MVDQDFFLPPRLPGCIVTVQDASLPCSAPKRRQSWYAFGVLLMTAFRWQGGSRAEAPHAGQDRRRARESHKRGAFYATEPATCPSSPTNSTPPSCAPPAPLARDRQQAFIAEVVATLQHVPMIGEGILYRTIATVQPRHFNPPRFADALSTPRWSR